MSFETGVTVLLVIFFFLTIYACVKIYYASIPDGHSVFHGYFSAFMNKSHHFYRSNYFHFLGRLFLDPIEKVSSNVWRILGLNPGSHTLQGTNTWLVGNGPSKILIDTGEEITSIKYVQFLIDIVFPLSNTTDISIILLSHGHGDHQGGVHTLLKELKKLNKKVPKIYKRQVQNGHFPSGNYICENIENDQCFNASDNEEIINLRAVYTPGHTDDHVAFILEEEKTSSLFSGDCVLGCGTTVFDDLYEYMNSLSALRTLMVKKKENDICHGRKKYIEKNSKIVSTIYPGHGPVVRDNALEKIDEYISHRMKREGEIYDILMIKFTSMIDMFRYDPNFLDYDSKMNKIKQSRHGILCQCGCNRIAEGSGDECKMDMAYDFIYLSSWEIMKTVYGPLPFIVQISAQMNVIHHLNKLKKEGKINFCYPDLWRIDKSFDNPNKNKD